MIDATTRQQNPCPICDSANVRWRGRRIYDMPLTWARTGFESVYSTLFSGGKSYRMGVGIRYVSTRQLGQEIRREQLEARTGMRTPTAFWRCPDCRNRGFVFEPRAPKTKRPPRIDDRRRPPGT